jgi:hypothetical protein
LDDALGETTPLEEMRCREGESQLILGDLGAAARPT